LLLLAAQAALPLHADQRDRSPDTATTPRVLFISIDTLRADRVSAYGHHRNTTPNIDRLIAGGVRYSQARTIEPLTAPALASMLTSRYPHEHAATRNGLRMRTGMASLPKTLQGRGYRTAAFVGNWTLRDHLSGIGEHFEIYEEVLTRRRYFGLVRGEANAFDVSELALDWAADHVRERRDQPFFLWVHYTEPHAPYKLQRDYLEQLGLDRRGDYTKEERYDTEIAYTDAAIGELLAGLRNLALLDDTLIVFLSDHGESLGEHKYWGHGRHLYEPTLRIPMSITWSGRLEPATVDAPALIIDLAPTVLGLTRQARPSDFRGFDWTDVLTAGAEPPYARQTHYQAHKGAVMSRHDSDLARRAGLLETGTIRGSIKEIYRVKNDKFKRWVFDLEQDPGELDSRSGIDETPSENLLQWLDTVQTALARFDSDLPQPLDDEEVDKMRALGYLD
jgi:arylsulfatase A-like enzyme